MALTGGSEGEALLRRGAVAARSAGGDLIAVHVLCPRRAAAGRPRGAHRQRALVEELAAPTTRWSARTFHLPGGLRSLRRRDPARDRGESAWSSRCRTHRTRHRGDCGARVRGHRRAHRDPLRRWLSASALPRIGGSAHPARRLAGFVTCAAGRSVADRRAAACAPRSRSPRACSATAARCRGRPDRRDLARALRRAALGLTLDFFFIDPLHDLHRRAASPPRAAAVRDDRGAGERGRRPCGTTHPSRPTGRSGVRAAPDRGRQRAARGRCDQSTRGPHPRGLPALDAVEVRDEDGTVPASSWRPLPESGTTGLPLAQDARLVLQRGPPGL